MAMLEVRDLEVYYGVIQAIKGISFDVKQGEIVALIGANGAGKTTTLHTITGLISAKTGKIVYEGTDITRVPGYKLVGMGIAHVPEGRRVFATLTVLQNLKMGAYTRKDKEEIEATLKMIYQRFPRLEERKNQLAGTLSGGERQRIAIARAILKDAPIVILDEATAFTDPENEDKIQSSIMALSKGKTLLVIAHRLSTIQNADQIVVLEKGHIVDQGTQAELLRRCLLYQKLWQAHIGAQGWAVTSGAKEGQ